MTTHMMIEPTTTQRTPYVGTDTGKLRVLQVALRYFPFMGGVETHTYEVARRLVQQGVETTVLTTDTTGKLPTFEQVEGIAVRRVRAYPADKDFFFAPGIVPAMQSARWDVVHIQGIHTLVAPLAMLAAQRARMPYVVTFHTGGHTSGLRNRFRETQWTVLRPLLARATRLIGVSRFEAAFFQRVLRLPAEQFAVIRNGAHLPQVPEPAPERTHNLIVSVGRLERYKGHHRILAALPELRKHIPDVKLLILGAGPYEDALRQQAQELGVADRVEIRMIPPGKRQEMAETLSRAALVTLLSEYEAHPIAVMESLGLKCPTLVADTSGMSELAQDGLVRAVPLDSTPEQIAAAAMREIRDPLRPEHVELPTWDNCVGEVLNLYRDVVRETKQTA